jgi:hypothetical protein
LEGLHLRASRDPRRPRRRDASALLIEKKRSRALI